MKLILPNGSSRYGAQMGRPNILPENRDALVELTLTRLTWVDGDYDQWGAYWGGGSGDFVYCAWNANVRVFVRAPNSTVAKLEVRGILPGAIFSNWHGSRK